MHITRALYAFAIGIAVFASAGHAIAVSTVPPMYYRRTIDVENNVGEGAIYIVQAGIRLMTPIPLAKII